MSEFLPVCVLLDVRMVRDARLPLDEMLATLKWARQIAENPDRLAPAARILVGNAGLSRHLWFAKTSHWHNPRSRQSLPKMGSRRRCACMLSG
jgi:hypothetical protein